MNYVVRNETVENRNDLVADGDEMETRWRRDGDEMDEVWARITVNVYPAMQ